MKRISKWLKKYFVPHAGNDFHPHLLRHESMLVFFLVIMVIELGFLVQVFLVFDKTKFLAQVLPAVLADLTNKERADNGAAPLTENALLDKAAQEKADDMARNGYFAHTSPEGKTPWYWFQQVGYNYIYAGENLAVNFFESNDVAQAWMNSPTHRENIVKKEYTEIGIGVATGTYQGHNTVFVAQLFGKPLVFADAPIKSADSPAPAVAPAPAPKSEPKPKPAPAPTPSPKPTPKPSPAPSPKPAPSPAPIVEPAPETTPTVTEPVLEPVVPVAVKVLGEESTSMPLATAAAPKMSVKSFFERALSSPRTTAAYIFETLGLIVLLVLVIMFVRSEVRHKPALARGFAMIAVILLLSYFNLYVFRAKTEVPLDDHNMSANVIDALGHSSTGEALTPSSAQ